MANTPTKQLAVAACALALAAVALGCGGSSSKTGTTATVNTAALWRNRTQQICTDGASAVRALGYVHITYGGIAQVGLPAVKHKLDVYVGRLLAILQTATQQERELHPPAQLSVAAGAERTIEAEEGDATGTLRRDVDAANSAAELSAAFNRWLERDAKLVQKGNAFARQYGLPECVATPPTGG
jgi:hypothetical protein